MIMYVWAKCNKDYFFHTHVSACIHPHLHTHTHTRVHEDEMTADDARAVSTWSAIALLELCHR